VGHGAQAEDAERKQAAGISQASNGVAGREHFRVRRPRSRFCRGAGTELSRGLVPTTVCESDGFFTAWATASVPRG